MRRVRPLTDDELEYLEYSAGHYVKLAQRHRRESMSLDLADAWAE